MATRPDTSKPESSLDTSLGLLTVVLAAALPLYRPWVTVATTAILALWLLGGALKPRIGILRGHRLTMAVLFFLALNIASLLWTEDLHAGLRYLTKYRYFLLIPMLASSVRPSYRRTAFTVFEVSAGVAALLSLGVFFGLLRFGGAHPGNPSPTMAHLDFGLLLALAALLALVRALYGEHSVFRRMGWAGLALLSIVGLMVNIGRAGYLAFAGGLAVLIVHWMRGRSVLLVVVVMVGMIAALVVVWFSSPTFTARVDEAQEEIRAAVVDNRYEGNLGGRLAAMRIAREVFREDPIFGAGVGGNIPSFRRIIDTRFSQFKPSIYWYRHFHNQYAQVATELGVAGLLALGWIFWELIRVPRRNREVDASALVLAAVYLFGFFGEPFFHKQITLVMFALFAGFVAAEDLESKLAIEGRATSR